MQTLTYNCPNCHQGNLRIWIVDSVTFEAKEGACGPVKVNLTGTAKCDSCEAEYKMNALDVKKWETLNVKKCNSSLEEN